MSSESSIAVTVRVRPFTHNEASQLAPASIDSPFFGDGSLSGVTPSALHTNRVRRVVQVLDERVLVFDPPEDNPIAKYQKTLLNSGKKVKDIRYAFDRIFDQNSSQEEVYSKTVQPLINGLFEGYNATVFAYGATGCGKTHTTSGTPEDPGLIFLTMRELFEKITDIKDDKSVELSLSYLEIYNENIRDLLIPGGSTRTLTIREDSNKKITVTGLSTQIPTSINEVMGMILVGNANRTMSPTEANAVSSRSHAVLQINILQKPRTAGLSENHTLATLSIIDLAGSERASATKNKGDRLLEGANINRSLLALGNCINALCDPHRRNHVPFRDSKLTRLLKFSLGGNCKTVMIVCVSPSSLHYDETHNTLKYGNRAKNIKTKVSRNFISVDRHVGQYVKAIYELRQEVEELKKKLAQKDTENGVVIKDPRWARTRDDKIRTISNAIERDFREQQHVLKDLMELEQLNELINISSIWLQALSSNSQESQREFTERQLTHLQSKKDILNNRILHSSAQLNIDQTITEGVSALKVVKSDDENILLFESQAREMMSAHYVNITEQKCEAFRTRGTSRAIRELLLKLMEIQISSSGDTSVLDSVNSLVTKNAELPQDNNPSPSTGSTHVPTSTAPTHISTFKFPPTTIPTGIPSPARSTSPRLFRTRTPRKSVSFPHKKKKSVRFADLEEKWVDEVPENESSSSQPALSSFISPAKRKLTFHNPDDSTSSSPADDSILTITSNTEHVLKPSLKQMTSLKGPIRKHSRNRFVPSPYSKKAPSRENKENEGVRSGARRIIFNSTRESGGKSRGRKWR
ncbi:Kinesin-like protein 6 [Neolecta irregularis DAH-3]|uniref:Kinesin-like protein n=1 Tax=Neolecta irregularis (strain DAH-3) TaxID=1198029 RepID=A0A1U7LRG0_NEOID|nr:Kinesin-like protein 6 [Neolecta irregularis DAH-3]|eukprot:OLL25260.1 Kinesin-like protein 6 [Neolecta irregularis DAH-3]